VLGNVAEWTQTKADLTDSDRPKNSSAPFAVTGKEEFLSVIGHDDWLHVMGGHHNTGGAGMCAATLSPGLQH